MQGKQDLLKWLGFNTQGDLGPWTMYTSQRKGLVFYSKAPPLEPPSILQTSVRNSIRLAAYTWNALTPEARVRWEASARRARLSIHGYNLFTFWILKRDDAAIHTIERLTGIDLIPLEWHY